MLSQQAIGEVDYEYRKGLLENLKRSWRERREGAFKVFEREGIGFAGKEKDLEPEEKHIIGWFKLFCRELGGRVKKDIVGYKMWTYECVGIEGVEHMDIEVAGHKGSIEGESLYFEAVREDGSTESFSIHGRSFHTSVSGDSVFNIFLHTKNGESSVKYQHYVESDDYDTGFKPVSVRTRVYRPRRIVLARNFERLEIKVE